jgi:PAS domain S-box-containing protein
MSSTPGTLDKQEALAKPHLRSHWRPSLVVAGTYLVFGLLWIALSDRILAATVTSVDTLNYLQTVKGFCYVFITGLLIFSLVRRYVGRIIESNRESEELRRRYQDLFDHAPDAIMIHDLQGHFLAVNEITCERLGYSPQELREMTPKDVDAPEFAASVDERITLLLKRGSLVFESAHVHRSGKVVPVEISSRLVDFGGERVILSNCRDISERKAAETDLRRSEEQFRAIFENAPMAIALVDLDGRCQRCNSNLKRFLGCAPDCQTSCCLLKIVYPQDYPRIETSFQQLLNGEHSAISLEGRFVRRDQSVIWGQLSACARRDATGNPDHYIVQILDITERKQRERQLRLTHYMVNKSIDAVYWMDESARFVYVNDTACQMLGYTRDELLKMEVFDIDPRMSHDLWAANWAKKKALGSIQLETEHCRRDGTRIPIEVTSSHVLFEGKSYNCAFARDITERKRHDEESRQLQDRLDRAQRMESLGILAGGVAHDLNNMLGPLVGYPDLILQNPNVDERTRRHVKRMAQSAVEAAEVIQDLLTLARRGRYDMESINLNEVITHFIDSPIFTKLKESHPAVDLHLELGDNVGNMKGSAPHLSKVIMNLIVNAYDAMAEGGTLTISTATEFVPRLESNVPVFEPGDYLVLRVSDTGKGIDAADLPKIFEPYYSKKKMGRSGSGLGLSVVYGIIKDHHGFYDVASQLGKGSNFTFYFPLTDEALPQLISPEASEGGKESILVVDDSSDQRELAAELLASLGYNVHTVTNGREAVEALSSARVDLVVLDMILEPGFDGLDTYRQIKRLHPQQKCVIISGFSATDRVDEMQRLGAGGYIRKPYTRDTLNRVIRQTLDCTVPVSESR